MRISDWSSDVCSSDLGDPDSNPFGQISNNLFKDRSKAVFGNLSFKLLDNLKLNAGYRHTWDREGVCAVNNRHFFGDPIRSYGECLATAGSFADRSDARRVGQEGVRSCKFRGVP